MNRLEAFITENEPRIYILWYDKIEAEAFLETEIGREISLRLQSIRELNKKVWCEDSKVETSTLDILKRLIGMELKKPVYVVDEVK